MKKVILQCAAFVLMGFGGYAQTLYVPGGTAGIGTTSTTNVGIGYPTPTEKLMVNGNIHFPMGNSIGFGLTSDRFTYDGKNVGNYSLSWVSDSWGGSPTAYLSSYGGVKIFAAGLPRLSIFENGNVGIGVTDSKGYKLAVGGKAIAEELVIKLQANWPDYVFEPEYKLPMLSDLESYIRANRHLPGIPSAADVKNNGIAVGEMNAALLKKVEELTLYMIEANKKIEALQNQVNDLSKRK